MTTFDPAAEWLEADGLGGFAMGTVAGIRTRRYHALLQVATTPPTGRMVLVDGCEAWIEMDGRSIPLTTQHYAPDVYHPDGAGRIRAFTADPWPRWEYQVEPGLVVALELFVPHGRPAVALRWQVAEGIAPRGMTLRVRPFLSGRDHHALQRENGVFRMDARVAGEIVEFSPYDGVPPVRSHANAAYSAEPLWYRNFLLAEERARGLDAVTDLASPGVFTWRLDQGPAVWLLDSGAEGIAGADALARYSGWRQAEAERRAALGTPLDRAADTYLVRRGSGHTIIAGYPWFTDWGRDTLIAIRGLCLATGRLAEARSILLEWATAVDRGMLPNRFVERGSAAEFNSVDASLWYVIAVHDYRQALSHRNLPESTADRADMDSAIEAILTGFLEGTRYGIRADEDGLLLAGEPGVQLTWMDAKVGDWVVTPRIGKPVEIQALWLNALRIAGTRSARWRRLYKRGLESFHQRFWHPAGYLFDVVDADGIRGTVDSSFRPNQVFAVGGLPFPLLEGERARMVVEAVELRLLTPTGLRSMAPGAPGYAPRYEGGVLERDGSYHQGTVWPWLMGPFVEAWLRVHPGRQQEARDRFFAPLLVHLGTAGLGHVSEITDAEAPFTPRGCPFQAWSVGELLRLDRVVLAAGRAAHPPAETRMAHAG